MKINEVMTSSSLKSTTAETNICIASLLMKINNLEVLPVLDENQKVIGMITQNNINLFREKIGHNKSGFAKVKDVMILNVHTLNSNKSVAFGLDYMIRNQIGRVYVIDQEGKLEGIVSLFKLIISDNKKDKNIADPLMKPIVLGEFLN